ncbi:phosphate ABC transporter ATP-binding protein [Candidatus Woesebacteria bacterium]|nr:phosphate ABC transporter ATP-binding protein [Candidatus Woesebacteria bacterium]
MNKITSKTPLLELRSISYSDGGNQILQNISFEVRAGEHLSITGPSGSGKSTLLRLINRLLEPTTGEVLIEGRNYTAIPPQQLRREVGLVLQSPFLFPGTVADNIRFGPSQVGKRLSDAVIDDLLQKMNLEDYRNRDVSKLSGGEAQRISLARTMANKPKILLLDEPTSALDKKSQLQIEAVLQQLVRTIDLTYIIVTHDPEQARRLTDRTITLEKGILC